MKIRPAAAELFHAEKRDEANSPFVTILRTRLKIKTFYNHGSFNIMSNTNTFSTLPCANLLIVSNLKAKIRGQRLGRMCAKNAAASTNISQLNMRVMLKYTIAKKPQLCTQSAGGIGHLNTLTVVLEFNDTAALHHG